MDDSYRAKILCGKFLVEGVRINLRRSDYVGIRWESFVEKLVFCVLCLCSPRVEEWLSSIYAIGAAPSISGESASVSIN